MKKSFAIFALVTISAIYGFGQKAVGKTSVCTNETVEKISSRGISLGMSQQEALNLFTENEKLTGVSVEYLQNEGRYKYSASEVEYQNIANNLQTQSARMFGFSSTFFAPKDKTKFDGISQYELGFLDNHLAFFRTFYTKPKWENREQFIRKMSEILNLPVQESYLNDSSYRLKCGNYTVAFGAENSENGLQYNMLVSANIDEILRGRRKKAEDEQREKDLKTFRP